MILAILAAAIPSLDDALAVTVLISFVLLIFVGYPVTIETLTRGRSIGKLAMGLRVVRDDGGPIRFRHALTRGLAGFIVDFTVMVGAVAVITSLASERGKRVGDILAGTVVVRERMPVSAGRPGGIVMPYPLAGWASTLELSRLSNDLALTARQFLLRAADLAPNVRAATAVRLATEVAGQVAPMSPPGTPAEAYLAAVIAERRRRETVRLAPAQPAAAWPAPQPPQPSPPQPVGHPVAVPPTSPSESPSPSGGFAPPG